MFVLIGMDGTGSYGYLYSERRNRKEFASRPFFAMSLRDARACPQSFKAGRRALCTAFTSV